MFLLLITNTVKNLWDSWNIRAVVLLSLALQVLLILLAPIRKRTTQRLWILFIWVSYLLADWAASFALDTSLAVAKTLIILVIGKILLLVLDTTSPTVKSQNL